MTLDAPRLTVRRATALAIAFTVPLTGGACARGEGDAAGESAPGSAPEFSKIATASLLPTWTAASSGVMPR